MDAPVIIVGAGPSGLVLAAELRLAGVERLRPGQARAAHRRVARSGLHRPDHGGLRPARSAAALRRRRDHHRWATSAACRWTTRCLEAFALGAPRRAAVPDRGRPGGMGRRARRGHPARLRGGRRSTADGDSVEVEVRGPGEAHQRLRAGYLVGCDGGRSTVRKAGRLRLPRHRRRPWRCTWPTSPAATCGRGMIGETLPGGMVMVGTAGRAACTRIIVCERGTPPRRRTEPPTFTRGRRRLAAADRRGHHATARAAGSARSATPPARSPSTGAAGCCWPATPRTSTCRPAARA